MIDTLARHLAALSEARRLMGLVLANNPDFVAWQRSADPAIEATLAGDRTFLAYRHLEAAVDLLRPEPFVKGADVEGADPTVAARDMTAGDSTPVVHVAPTATPAGISAKVVLLQPRTTNRVRVAAQDANPAAKPVDLDVSGAEAQAASGDAPAVAARAVVSAAIVADGIVYGPHLQEEAAVSIVRPGPGPAAAGAGSPQVGDLIDRSTVWPSNGSQQPATEPPRRRRWLSALFGRRLENSA